MKNLKYILFAILPAMLLASCTEDFPASTSITYPSIVMGGDAIEVISVGDAYTLPTTEAFIGEDPTEITVTGTVDPNTAGIYTINYGASNPEGFEATAFRTVVVMETAPSAVNMVGTWSRANGNDNVITQVSDRVYNSQNLGGAWAPGDDRNLMADFFVVDDVALFVPFQENASVTGASVVSFLNGQTPVSRINSATQFQWALNASLHYGTFTRTFDLE